MILTVPNPSHRATYAFDMHQPLLYGPDSYARRSIFGVRLNIIFGGHLRIEHNRIVHHLALNEIQAWFRDSRQKQHSPMLTNTKDSGWHRLQLIAMFRKVARSCAIDVEKTHGGIVSGLQTSYLQGGLVENDCKVSDPRI